MQKNNEEGCMEKTIRDERKTLEMIIHCHKCKTNWQLNPDMIAVSLSTKQTVWDVYKYVLTTECDICYPKERDNETTDT